MKTGKIRVIVLTLFICAAILLLSIGGSIILLSNGPSALNVILILFFMPIIVVTTIFIILIVGSGLFIIEGDRIGKHKKIFSSKGNKPFKLLNIYNNTLLYLRKTFQIKLV